MAKAPAKGEFERIATYFAPLARDFPGAFGLLDDAAVISLGADDDLVVTTDTVVSGVHFVGDEPPDLIARKLLRVNLSDLAAKGSLPLGYTLNVALPRDIDDGWLEAFAAGLRTDQAEFRLALIGGDSVSTSGPVTLTVTAFGTVPRGKMIRRSGARTGDGIYVSGSIGDGALGLAAAHGRLAAAPSVDIGYLVDRYRLPRPRIGVGHRLLGVAHAAADISDGLAADMEHIADSSGLCAVIESARIPLSDAAAAVVAESPERMTAVLTGGDDYELLFASSDPAAVDMVANETGVAITCIGSFQDGNGVRIRDAEGRDMELGLKGFRHV